MTIEPIIDPIARELIESELTPQRLMRYTNNAGNEIYVVTASDSPHTMQEIGRLRELSFREAGGGTGQAMDIDENDTAPDGYNQLIVWDPAAKQIVGGYRFIISCSGNTPHLSTEHYFRFSDRFRTDFLPWTIELGRSFVQPLYQGTRKNPKGIYSLDNLWDGLGALMVHNPDMRYFLGKVTMYGDYNKAARNILIYFLERYFPDRDGLLDPIYPIELDMDREGLARLFCGQTYEENYRILVREIRSRNENIPPLINSYMSLSPTMRTFGTVCNPDFGQVEETGILITIEDLYPKKVERHMRNASKNQDE